MAFRYCRAKLSLKLAIVLLCLSTGISKGSTQERPDANFRELLKQTIEQSKSFEDRFSAEVWLVDMASRLRKLVPQLSEDERLSILKTVHQESSKLRLNPQLVLALIQVESAFDRFAISSAGARGLMQVMPFWIEEIGKPTDNLFDIATNIRYGCAILSLYIKRERRRLTEGLARYNGSVGKTWYPERVFKAWDRRWFVRNY